MKAKTTNDPQPVFDALDEFVKGTPYTSANASVLLDGAGTSHTMNCQDAAGNSISYTERTAGIRVTVTPMSVSLGPGQSQQFSATAINPDGSEVPAASFTWTLASGGAMGDVTPSGLYTAPAAIVSPASDSLRCTLTGQPAWATVVVGLHP